MYGIYIRVRFSALYLLNVLAYELHVLTLVASAACIRRTNRRYPAFWQSVQTKQQVTYISRNCVVPLFSHCRRAISCKKFKFNIFLRMKINFFFFCVLVNLLLALGKFYFSKSKMTRKNANYTYLFSFIYNFDHFQLLCLLTKCSYAGFLQHLHIITVFYSLLFKNKTKKKIIIIIKGYAKIVINKNKIIRNISKMVWQKLKIVYSWNLLFTPLIAREHSLHAY